jgi:hypothetical protein
MRLIQHAIVALLIYTAAACGDSEASDSESVCDAIPEGLIVPIETSPSSAPVHWAVTKGCIPVTYDPAVADRRADIEAGLDMWASIDCSMVCFENLIESADVPELDPERRVIHVGLAEKLTPETPDLPSVLLTFAHDSGEMLLVYIALDTLARPLTPTDWAHSIGLALGMGYVQQPDIDSLLTWDYMAKGVAMPTETDLATFCTVYGDPPLCTP